MKKASIGAASVAGVTIVLSAFCSAGPAQAVFACWDSAYGHHCRDFGDGPAGQATVQVVTHPTFTGILREGETLSSFPGEWNGAGTLKYQWLRDGLAVPGAVGETYEITGADAGRSLALRVTASAEGLKDGVETTLPSPEVSETNTGEYTARPAITGQAPEIEGSSRVGFTLEVNNLGTWSPSQLTVKMQWQADGVDIPGATGDAYTIKTADLGKSVTLKVTAGSSGVSASNTAPVVTPGYIDSGDEQYLNGGSKVGDTLTVATLGKWYAGSEPVSFLFQWMRDGQPIIGATASTYDIVSADTGHEIYVAVTGTAPGYAPHTQTTLYVVVDGDTQPTPVPAPSVPATPVPTPTPTTSVPATPVPTPTPTTSVPATTVPTTPVPTSPVPVPVSKAPIPRPEAENTPAQNEVPAPGKEGTVQPQSAGPARTPVARSGSPAAVVDAPAEAPAEPAEATATTPDTADATPTVTAGPAPSSTQGPAVVTAPVSSAEGYNPLPLAIPILGVLIAVGLAWFVRPIRAAVTRLVGRQAK